MKLNIPKITRASYQIMTNAYKNKYTSKWFQISHTWLLVQNQARHATYTPRATKDLELCIYKKLGIFQE
jgi:hypothetical protein